ncbi:MAG TPA: sulfatase-like hydrolase/transferase [Rubrobacteraceae bacterium]|nr:sulfatase-like hydrolase/transferase [Rubrobacteraceae bacterium]
MLGLLGREDWIYLLSLLVPLCLYDVALKVIRILTQLDVPGPVGFLDQVRSDIFFNLGYAVLWIGLFAIIRSGIPRYLLLILFHVSALLVAVLATSAHFFYEITGSALSFDFIVLSLSKFGEVQGAITSETTPLLWVLLSVVLFYAISGPAIVTFYMTRDWHVPVRTAGRPWAAPLVICVSAAAFGGLSLLPSATGASDTFSRDSLANLFVMEMSAPDMKAIRAETTTELASEKQPLHTKFVSTPQTKKPNVVMIFLESTRAESTTPYKKDLKTTPFLDALSKKSTVAERAYAVVPHTSKALLATSCGVAPPLDTENTESEPGVIPGRCIPQLLEDHGYKTAFFQSATEDFERRRALADNFGYDEFFPVNIMDKEGFEPVNYFGYEDNIMLKPSEQWLEKNGNQGPFLATYLTVTTHHNYTVPSRYPKQHFADDKVLNNYLNDVYYEDQFLKALFQQYKDLGLYDNTVFILLGDHGEGFGEHGLYQHDNTIYNEGLHIPFIIHDGRDPKPGRIEAPVDEMDVLPTLADILGYDIKGGTYPGSSMFSVPKNRTLMASCYHENTCLASIKGDEKYIYHFGQRDDEFFDLSKDPHEQDNLDEDHKKEMEKRRHDLLAWEAKVKAIYDQRLADLSRERTSPTEKAAEDN